MKALKAIDYFRYVFEVKCRYFNENEKTYF